MIADATLALRTPAGSVHVSLPVRGTVFDLFHELSIALAREARRSTLDVVTGAATLAIVIPPHLRADVQVPMCLDLVTTCRRGDIALAKALADEIMNDALRRNRT